MEQYNCMEVNENYIYESAKVIENRLNNSIFNLKTKVIPVREFYYEKELLIESIVQDNKGKKILQLYFTHKDNDSIIYFRKKNFGFELETKKIITSDKIEKIKSSDEKLFRLLMSNLEFYEQNNFYNNKEFKLFKKFMLEKGFILKSEKYKIYEKKFDVRLKGLFSFKDIGTIEILMPRISSKYFNTSHYSYKEKEKEIGINLLFKSLNKYNEYIYSNTFYKNDGELLIKDPYSLRENKYIYIINKYSDKTFYNKLTRIFESLENSSLIPKRNLFFNNDFQKENLLTESEKYKKINKLIREFIELKLEDNIKPSLEYVIDKMKSNEELLKKKKEILKNIIRLYRTKKDPFPSKELSYVYNNNILKLKKIYQQDIELYLYCKSRYDLISQSHMSRVLNDIINDNEINLKDKSPIREKPSLEPLF